jgi:hypothetical protein
MTEKEWLECDGPCWLRGQLPLEEDSRKNLLFVSACFRRSWELLPEVARNWVVTAENVADGLSNADALRRIDAGLDDWFWEEHDRDLEEKDRGVNSNRSFIYPLWHVFVFTKVAKGESDESPFRIEQGHQAALLRDVIGNPFHPIRVDSSWLTDNVVPLAGCIYDERAFERLPILADALEESGCTDRNILDHLREPGFHVRGCWVVDLLLAKE